MASDDTNKPDATRPLGEDLYCLECGYNQRGLAGDPVRCPECFSLNSLAELRGEFVETPGQRFRRLLSRLETTATICALAITALGLLLLVRLVEPSWYYRLRSPVAKTAGVIWLCGFTLFAVQCHGLSGWVKALAEYHLYRVSAMVGNLAIVCLGFYASWRFASTATNMGSLTFLLGIVCTVAFIAYVNPMRWLRRRGTAALLPLVRQLFRRASERREH